MILTDTIIAISSPPGPAQRGIIRLTGPHAWPLASQLLPIPQPLTPGYHGPFPLPLIHPTAKIAHALLFKSPKSFTAQDIAELHLPASPALLNAVIEKALSLAPTTLRLADPGEFSARAFFNNKIDLTQAEGIAATINATNESQLRAAASLRSGHLYQWIAATAEKIASLLANIEAGIDFSDEEDVSFIDTATLRRDLANLLLDVLHHQLSSRRLESFNELPTIVLTGPPNVGKSSLLNALTNSQRAIVSPIAGTTRDALASIMTTPIGDLRIIDVAGIESSTNSLSQQMNTARHQALATADLIINVNSLDVPHSLPNPSEHPEGIPTLQVLNKSDLPHSHITPLPSALRVSTKTGEGMDLLRKKILQTLEPTELAATQRTTLNQRHREILSQFDLSLHRAHSLTKTPHTTNKHPELLAAELRLSLDLLGQITGTISPDEIIGRIFSQFCIGK